LKRKKICFEVYRKYRRYENIVFTFVTFQGAAGKSLKLGADDKTQAIMTAMKSRMMEVERKHFKTFDLIR